MAFLESETYEDAVRKAVSLGGDSDTLGCMTGGIAQAYYKHVPDNIVIKVRELLNEDLLEVIDEFNGRFGL
jgi:ADP-ribosylglycohydrolase